MPIRNKVIIAGAGPGDPELITYKAIKALRKADVVITDRLVSATILELYVSKEAEIIFAGKQRANDQSAQQTDINQLLVEFALAGKQVVRLKGGDVSIFSNIFDELQELKRNKIPYEIIPGITAASGAAAYSGIPLTAKSYASAVRFLSYYKQGSFSEAYWKELAATNDTLVFYMTGEIVEDLVTNLTRHGIDPKKSMAVIEQATTPLQNIRIYNFYRHKTMPLSEIISPSLIIIGKVVNLHRAFGWIKNYTNGAQYFTNIEENHITSFNQQISLAL